MWYILERRSSCTHTLALEVVSVYAGKYAPGTMSKCHICNSPLKLPLSKAMGWRIDARRRALPGGQKFEHGIN
jgi:hypothetical protein